MKHYEIVELKVEKDEIFEFPDTRMYHESKVLIVLEGKIQQNNTESTIETGSYIVLEGTEKGQNVCALEKSKVLMIASKANGVAKVQKLEQVTYLSKHTHFGRIIAKSINTGVTIEAKHIEALFDALKERDPFEGDLFSHYSDLFFSIFSELSLDPLKLSKIYCARLGAMWILNSENPERSLDEAVRFIEKAYNELFLPSVEINLIRNSVYWTLLNNKEQKTVQYIADKLFTNRTYLSERFKQLTGITLSKYILRVKMYGAMLLLIDSSLCFSDVLDILGYKDDNHFIRVFKKFTGLTPNEFSKQFTRMNTGK